MPKWFLLPALSCLCLVSIAFTQNDPMQTAPAAQTQGTVTKGFMLEDGTPVKLRIGRTVSSADANIGETVDFEVLEEVDINGVTVIPKGGNAVATITQAAAKRRMGKGGKLDVNIDYVRLASGEKAALRAIKEMKGSGSTGAMTGGMVVTSLVFWPAAPLFLFMHGKDITIPKGTEITAYVNGDMKLDFARFTPTQPGATPSLSANATTNAAPAQSQGQTTQLEVSSRPDAADIEIDGNFVGSTPSTVGVTSGQHTIAVSKNGFKTWERKITVSSGHVKINAQLDTDGKVSNKF